MPQLGPVQTIPGYTSSSPSWAKNLLKARSKSHVRLRRHHPYLRHEKDQKKDEVLGPVSVKAPSGEQRRDEQEARAQTHLRDKVETVYTKRPNKTKHVSFAVQEEHEHGFANATDELTRELVERYGISREREVQALTGEIRNPRPWAQASSRFPVKGCRKPTGQAFTTTKTFTTTTTTSTNQSDGEEKPLPPVKAHCIVTGIPYLSQQANRQKRKAWNAAESARMRKEALRAWEARRAGEAVQWAWDMAPATLKERYERLLDEAHVLAERNMQEMARKTRVACGVQPAVFKKNIDPDKFRQYRVIQLKGESQVDPESRAVLQQMWKEVYEELKSY